MNSLNDDEFRDLPPRERRYEIQVADNLFFAVFPNGVKAWVLVYRFDGIVRRQTLGTFPDMGLARALNEADKDPTVSARTDPTPRSGRTDRRRWLLAAAAAAGLAITAVAFYLAAGREAGAAAVPALPASAAPGGARAAWAEAGTADPSLVPQMSAAPVNAAGVTRLPDPKAERDPGVVR
jgi:hypothetical protein